MRFVVQRVSEASVKIDDEILSSVNKLREKKEFIEEKVAKTES